MTTSNLYYNINDPELMVKCKREDGSVYYIFRTHIQQDLVLPDINYSYEMV